MFGSPKPISKDRTRALQREYADAAGDIHNMINDLPAPEGKDYPKSSQYGDPWKLAVQTHVDRITKLQEVERELREIAEDLADQLDGRKTDG